MKTFSRTFQTGISLIEVLVALLVLSVGLLGLAGLQANGSKFNNSAYLRTQAYIQAYDMADRMRNNLDGVKAGNYNAVPALADVVDAGTLTKDCVAETCTPAQMATYDMEVWQKSNNLLLPTTTGGSITNNNNGTFTITVSWNEDFRRLKTQSKDAANPLNTRFVSIDVIP